ncbi:MAG: TlpA family protein disulfide reductase [Lachnospiraceae bacterium]|nr:TlpA family protein disulfide reductase [Lachnospiraceae bacterium]
MNKYLKFTIAIISFALVIVLANVLYNKLAKDYDMGDGLVTEDTTVSTEKDTQSESDTEKNIAPDFTVVDKDNREVNLESFFGKPIVLNFWASWCGPCKSEFPEFQTAYEEYGEEIEFLMVNMTDGRRETKELADAFIQSEGYSLPVYYDVNQDGAYTYGVYSLPTTYFIDSQGNLVAYAQGAIDMDTLKKGIDMIR